MLTKFQFKWTPFIITLIMLVVMVFLGFWQLHRYSFKKDLLSRHQKNRAQQLHSWHQFKEAGQKEFFRIKVRGTYLNQKSVLLDNRRHKDKIGYEVITPLQVIGEKKLLLVNRGWISRGKSRNDLPKLEAIMGVQAVQGYINKPSSPRFMLGKNIENQHQWPLRMQYLNFKQLALVIDKPIYPYVLRLAPNASSGFARQWVLVVSQPSRHLGYAIQWFLMSLALMVAYFYFSCHQSSRRKSKDEDGQ